jgi:NCAIR mutase (PurE)-related protein
MLTIGMMASLASITLATGALAGVGLVFGGKQILDERNRQLQARRQQARTNAKQFIDDLQFETNKRVRDLSRDLQRQLRDGFLELVATRQRTCTDSLAAVQAAVQQDASARASQITSLRERLDQLKAIDTRAAEAEAAL